MSNESFRGEGARITKISASQLGKSVFSEITPLDSSKLGLEREKTEFMAR